MNKKNILIVAGILLLVVATVLILAFRPHDKPEIKNDNIIKKNSMKLDSPAFKNNEYIPTKFTCDGLNINPQLNISEVPSGTKSLALIMDDPDSPTGTWIHWLVWNIDQNAEEIAEDSVPAGAEQGATSAKNNNYNGPCPGTGIHHYNFKLYALDTKLTLDTGATKTDLENAMDGHVLTQATLIGLYSR